MNSDPANRRDGERIPVPDLHIDIANIDEQGQIEVTSGRCVCLDLSSSGMQVVANQMLAPGRRYGFRVASPALGKPNWFIGKVRWGCETEGGEIRAGICFEALDANDRAVLIRLLELRARAEVS